MNATSIEWTDLSVNPIRARRLDNGQRVPGHFCQKISPGCAHCYASRTQPRFGLPQFPGTDKSPADVGVEVFLDQKVLESVLRRRKPGKLFWFDMTDAFGDWVPFDWLDQCFAVMALTPHLTHQVLTKRPERMAEYMADERGDEINSHAGTFMKYDEMPNASWPLPNVWLGTSAENQDQADKRILHLQRCPAAVRFLSVEPLLGPVNLDRWIHDGVRPGVDVDIDGQSWAGANREPYIDRPPIQWVIVGGESGPGARPMHPDWARSIRDQCAAAGVPFFFKQWGAWEPVTPLYDGRDDAAENGRGELEMVDTRGHIWDPDQDGQPNDMRTWQMELVGKHAAGRLLDGREHNDMPKPAEVAHA